MRLMLYQDDGDWKDHRVASDGTDSRMMLKAGFVIMRTRDLLID
jgi:hypothetical protein